MSETYKHLEIETDGAVCRVTLNRPDVHNAFNAELIEELRRAFAYAEDAPASEVRVVVLAGNGRSFCAGADVNWMRASLDFTEEENISDAMRMAHMFSTIDRCRVPVIGRIHGAALGGGVGLAAVCDIVVAAEDAVFGLSEVRLGIAPAVISPYVLAKIGRSHARALFLSGQRFGAERALAVGLVHQIAPEAQLDDLIERTITDVLASSPNGIGRAKQLIRIVPDLDPEHAMQLTAETIANLRTSAEGQEGLRAFLEKRNPEWAS